MDSVLSEILAIIENRSSIGDNDPCLMELKELLMSFASENVITYQSPEFHTNYLKNWGALTIILNVKLGLDYSKLRGWKKDIADTLKREG